MALRLISFYWKHFPFSRGLRQQIPRQSFHMINDCILVLLHVPINWSYQQKSLFPASKVIQKYFFFPVTSALTRFSTNLFFMKSTFGNVTVLTIDRKMNRDIHESLSDNSCIPKENRNCAKFLTPLKNFKDLFLKFLLCRQQLHFHAA